MSTKRTYHPSRKRKIKTHGYRTRISTAKGRLVLKRRSGKGRKRLIP